MIQEAYVSFEVAKLLKEKGFPQDPYMCNTAYTSRGRMSNNAKSFMHNSHLLVQSRCYSIAPTQQMAMRWLREVHDLNIEIDTIGRKDKGTLSWRSTVYNLNNQYECYYNETCESYEQACEAAIKYCLENLI